MFEIHFFSLQTREKIPLSLIFFSLSICFRYVYFLSRYQVVDKTLQRSGKISFQYSETVKC